MLIPRLDVRFSLPQQLSFVFGKPYLPHKGEFLLNHSRCAIFLALKSLRLPPRTGIGVMVYNCHTVMNAIEQAGYTNVFIDVDDNLMIDFDDLRKKASLISALVVTHLFGIVNDIQAIKNEFPHLLVIEDCAHAGGIEHLHGDFATFSIGQGKFPSLGDGGILLVLNGQYLDEVNTIYSQISSYSIVESLGLFTKLLINSILYVPWVYCWLTFPIKRRRYYISGREKVNQKKMNRGVSAMYASTKAKVDVEKEIRKKLQIAKFEAQWIAKDINHYCIGFNAFMLVANCDNPKLLQEKLRKRGVESATHFVCAIDWALEFGYRYGDCPNAEKLINHLLMLPTYKQHNNNESLVHD